MKQKYYRIFNKETKKYVKLDDGSFLVMEYPEQCENYISKRLGHPKIDEIQKLYDIREFKK